MSRTLRVACFSLVLVLLSGVSAALEEDVPAGWLTSLDEAVELARSSQRQIMVDLWADWCTWCKRLEEDVFSTAEFAEYAQRFVLLRVDTDDGGEGTRLMERFQVASLPTTLILTADLVKVGELQGYLKAEQYIQSLDLERDPFFWNDYARHHTHSTGHCACRIVYSRDAFPGGTTTHRTPGRLGSHRN